MISYAALETHPPRKSILGSLRKREYQTRQQQVRRGTPRRIGCPPRLYDDDSAFVHPQQVISPQGSPEIGTGGSQRSSVTIVNRGVIHHHHHHPSHNTSGGKRSSSGKGPGEAGAGKLSLSSASLPPHPRLFPSRKSSSPSLSSSYNASFSSLSAHSSSQPASALHPLASSLTRDDTDLDPDAMDTTPDLSASTSDSAMDWTAVSTPSSTPSRRLSVSSTTSTTKSFVMVNYSVTDGVGSSSTVSTPSIMSLGSSSPASSLTNDPSANVSRTHAALMNAHLSAAQFGGGVGRRMSSPSISTTMASNSPYNHSPPGSSTSLSCRRTTADVMQPRPNSALSGARTWVASSSSTPSVSSFSGSGTAAEGQTPSLKKRNSSASLHQPSAVVPKKISGKKLDGTADIVSSRMPLIVAEREFSMNGYDKIFTAKWISSDEVLMGTKCNKV